MSAASQMMILALQARYQCEELGVANLIGNLLIRQMLEGRMAFSLTFGSQDPTGRKGTIQTRYDQFVTRYGHDLRVTMLLSAVEPILAATAMKRLLRGTQLPIHTQIWDSRDAVPKFEVSNEEVPPRIDGEDQEEYGNRVQSEIHRVLAGRLVEICTRGPVVYAALRQALEDFRLIPMYGDEHSTKIRRSNDRTAKLVEAILGPKDD
jgi:hypothetical protein